MKKKNIFKIIKNWKNPILLRDAFINKFASIIYRRNKGTFIVNEQWENLIILDACRYDFFKDQFIPRNIQGNLSFKISRGSHTVSFLLENFNKSKYDDIIYITANPYVNQFLRNKFYKIISVWKDGWDEKEKTVLPETMLKYAIEAKMKYPKKKLVIHFMQPHYPYISYKFEHKKSESLRKSSDFPRLSKIIKNKNFFTLYSASIYSSIEKQIHIKAYKDNLNLALDIVEKLLKFLPGTTIITSDHGESFGERIFPFFPFKLFGHHRRFKIPVLLRVPWFEFKSPYEDTQFSIDTDEKLKIKEIAQNIGKKT
ncbi:MAG: hypothetical protein ACFFA4_07540 [Promethearchaeota archaeon]